MPYREESVRVWDLFVRLGHWTLVAAFVIAYLTAEDAEEAHVIAGYVVGGYLVARVVWGFIGTPHARFKDFVYRPRAILRYIVDVTRAKAPRYLGHNPAGGAMVIALLLSLSGTVFTGVALEAATENEGPLAGLFGAPDAPRAAKADGSAAAAGDESRREMPESSLEEVHEAFANLTLILIVVHILGVITSSLEQRENLVRSMITGDKRTLERKD